MTGSNIMEWWKTYVGPKMAAQYAAFGSSLCLFVAQATYHGVQLGLDKKLQNRTYDDLMDFHAFSDPCEDERVSINALFQELILLQSNSKSKEEETYSYAYAIREAAWCFYVSKHGMRNTKRKRKGISPWRHSKKLWAMKCMINTLYNCTPYCIPTLVIAEALANY